MVLPSPTTSPATAAPVSAPVTLCSSPVEALHAATAPSISEASLGVAPPTLSVEDTEEEGEEAVPAAPAEGEGEEELPTPTSHATSGANLTAEPAASSAPCHSTAASGGITTPPPPETPPR
jgi:hypothetical protein